MNLSRKRILIGIAVLFLGFILWKLFAGDGTITVNFRDAPLHKVISAIERQGNVQIATNVDPETKVTLQLYKAPLYDAMDTLAVRVDANLRLAYIIAPSKSQIKEALEAYETNQNSGGWKIFYYPRGGLMRSDSDSSYDPRQLKCTLATDGPSNFQTVLDQVTQKSGAMVATPEDWNPDIKKLNIKTTLIRLFPKLTNMVHAKVEELFLITAFPHRSDSDTAGDNAGTEWNNANNTGIFALHHWQRSNPAWMMERSYAEIDMLPADQRADVKKQYDDMRKFFDSLRNLTPEERREKLANDQNIQNQMLARQDARSEKMSAEQRTQRLQHYVARKTQAMNGGQQPSAPPSHP